MENTFRIEDLPETADLQIFVGGFVGFYTFRLLKGSPLRRLLERQEEYQEAHDAAVRKTNKGFSE